MKWHLWFVSAPTAVFGRACGDTLAAQAASGILHAQDFSEMSVRQVVKTMVALNGYESPIVHPLMVVRGKRLILQQHQACIKYPPGKHHVNHVSFFIILVEVCHHFLVHSYMLK